MHQVNASHLKKHFIMKKNFTRTIVFTILFININLSTMAQTSVKTENGQKIFSEMSTTEKVHVTLKPENDGKIFSEIRTFLKQLNSGDGKPIEQLSPAAARQVLTDVQNSATIDY